jgi:hypothetical protein
MVKAGRVVLGVYGDRFNSDIVRGTGNANGNLTAIRDEYT